MVRFFLTYRVNEEVLQPLTCNVELHHSSVQESQTATFRDLHEPQTSKYTSKIIRIRLLLGPLNPTSLQGLRVEHPRVLIQFDDHPRMAPQDVGAQRKIRRDQLPGIVRVHDKDVLGQWLGTPVEYQGVKLDLSPRSNPLGDHQVELVDGVALGWHWDP